MPDISMESEYTAIIIDNTDVFTDEQEEALLSEMSSLCEHGNVCITTLVSFEGLTFNIMNDLYTDTFGDTDGVILFIETKQSAMNIHCHGELAQELDSQALRDITAEIAGYATAGDYYACADNFIAETRFFFFNKELSAPMKLVTSALLAAIIGITVTYFIVKAVYGKKTSTQKEMLRAIFSQQKVEDTEREPMGVSNIVKVPKYLREINTNNDDDYF